MEMEISVEKTNSYHKKAKNKRREADNNTDANHDCPHESLLEKNTSVDPLTDATSERKKVNERTKKRIDTENLEMNANHESTVLVPDEMEAADVELAANGISGKNKKSKGKAQRSDAGGAPTAVVDTDLDPSDGVTRRKKKKQKRSNDPEMTTVVSESTLLVSSKLEAGVDAINLDPTADIASGKKKKKTRRSDDVEMTSVGDQMEASADTNQDPLIDSAPVEKKKKRKSKRSDDAEIKSEAPTKVEAMYLDPKDDFTHEEKKKKKDNQISDESEASAANLDPMVDVIPREKKKKKTKKRDDLEKKPLNGSTSLVPMEAEATTEALLVEPEANVKSGKRKKKAKRSSDLVMATVDNDSASVVTVIEKATNLEPPENVNAEVKKQKKKTKGSDNLGVTTVDSESTVLESAVLSEATTSENLSLDLGCLENKKGKRKRKRKDKQAEADNATESNDKVCEVGEESVTPNVILNNKESVLLSVEEPILAEEKGANKNSDADYSLAIDKDAKEFEEDSNLAGKYDTKENSLVVVEERDLPNGVKSSSIISQSDCCPMVSHVLGLTKNETYETDKSNECSDLGKSSDSFLIQCPKNGDDDDSLSHDLMEVTPSVLLEKTSSQVDDEVSKRVVDVLIEKETVNHSDLHLDSIGKPERSLVSRSNKKLLILDVNGILVDFVNYNPRPYKADITISKKYVFKRPYCDEFLRFCFERFNVGVWSSRMKQNMERAIDFLFRDSKEKLFLCWDQSHCTITEFNTLENRSKPLVLKELRKVWEKVEPDLPFEKGEYDETNTLLLDDSPYKALRNPPNTAIFPESYRYIYKSDDTLGPEGALRTYLERLSLVDNVQKFVEQNPYGQPAITESHISWNFYSKIVNTDQICFKL